MATIQFICPDAATEPATAATLQALRDEDKMDCPICLFPFAGFLTDAEPTPDNSCIDPITLLACNHTFCTACLTRWMGKAPDIAISCPMCRTHIGNKSDTFIATQQSTIAFTRAMQRMERFRAAYSTAAAAVTAAHNNDIPPPTLRFGVEQVFNAGGGLLRLMSDAIDNMPPPPEDAGQPVTLPVFGSPRFLRFVAALPTAALGVVRQLSSAATNPQQPEHLLWQVVGIATVTQLRRLLLLKLFALYLERFGVDVAGAGELAGGVVSDWQRGVQGTLEEIVDTGMPAEEMLQADRTLMEVDRYVRMVIGVIVEVDNNGGNGGVQAAAAVA